MPPRNVVLLLVDCLRADKVYGRERTCQTPNLDGLRSRGVSFIQAVTASTTTTPSLSSMLTALYPPDHGVRSLYGYRLRPWVRTYPQILRSAGYHAFIHAAGPLSPGASGIGGFERWWFFEQAGGGAYGPKHRDLISKLREGLPEPWFLLIHLWELHSPRYVPREYNRSEFGANPYERALSALDHKIGEILDLVDPSDLVILTGDHGEMIADTMAGYWILRARNLILRALGKVGLVEPGLLRRTGHGFHVLEPLVRVPLIAAGGPLPRGAEVREQVSLVDVMPTVSDLVGLGVHPRYPIRGRSLTGLIRGEADGWVEEAYVEAAGSVLPRRELWISGLRTPKYKYAFTPYAARIREFLFDLERDPGETRNLARDLPEVARAMRGRVERILREAEVASRIRSAAARLRSRIAGRGRGAG